MRKFVPICAASKKQSIKSPKDLLDGPLIHILGHEDNWDRYFSAHNLKMDRGEVRLFTDTTNAALSMVAAGGGYATIITRLAKSAIGFGHEFVLAGQPLPFPQAHYLVNPISHTPPRAEVEIFRSWLKSCFAEEG